MGSGSSSSLQSRTPRSSSRRHSRHWGSRIGRRAGRSQRSETSLVTSAAVNGDITLSGNATASATRVPLQIGIPYNANAATFQTILEGMPNIGPGNVAVTGNVGGPWTVEFKGARYADTGVQQFDSGIQEQALLPLTSGLTVSSGAKELTVTSSKGAEVCRVAVECQAPIPGTGPGQFDSTAFGTKLALAPGGGVLAVSARRIQRFDAEGAYQSQLEAQVPDGAIIAGFAADPLGGSLYAVLSGNHSVAVLDPVTGQATRSLQLDRPLGIATDSGGNVFVNAREAGPGDPESAGDAAGPFDRLIEFDPTGKRVSVVGEAGAEPNSASHFSLSEVGAGPLGDVYASYRGQGTAFLRVFGPAPVSLEAPPRRAPQVTAQFAATVDAEEAELKAKINPRFWNDTEYHVEYGTAPCNEGGCTSTTDVNLTHKFFDALRVRRQLFRDLGRKYGADLAEVIVFRTEAAARLDALRGHDDVSRSWRRRVRPPGPGVDRPPWPSCVRCGPRRPSRSPTRSPPSSRRLAMPGAWIGVEVTAAEPGEDGADDVTMLLAANPGEPPNPLAKVASGGEPSRGACCAIRVGARTASPARHGASDPAAGCSCSTRSTPGSAGGGCRGGGARRNSRGTPRYSASPTWRRSRPARTQVVVRKGRPRRPDGRAGGGRRRGAAGDRAVTDVGGDRVVRPRLPLRRGAAGAATTSTRAFVRRCAR